MELQKSPEIVVQGEDIDQRLIYLERELEECKQRIKTYAPELQSVPLSVPLQESLSAVKITRISGRRGDLVDLIRLHLNTGEVKEYGKMGGYEIEPIDLDMDEYISLVQHYPDRYGCMGHAIRFHTNKKIILLTGVRHGIDSIGGENAWHQSHQFAVPRGESLIGLKIGSAGRPNLLRGIETNVDFLKYKLMVEQKDGLLCTPNFNKTHIMVPRGLWKGMFLHDALYTILSHPNWDTKKSSGFQNNQRGDFILKHWINAVFGQKKRYPDAHNYAEYFVNEFYQGKESIQDVDPPLSVVPLPTGGASQSSFGLDLPEGFNLADMVSGGASGADMVSGGASGADMVSGGASGAGQRVRRTFKKGGRVIWRSYDDPDLADVPYDPSLCSKRIWNGGLGAQCQSAKMGGDSSSEFCTRCTKEFGDKGALPFGYYDQEKPEFDLVTGKALPWKKPGESIDFFSNPSMKVSEIREMLEERGLDSSGKKKEIEERLDAYLKAEEQQDQEDQEDQEVIHESPLEDFKDTEKNPKMKGRSKYKNKKKRKSKRKTRKTRKPRRTRRTQRTRRTRRTRRTKKTRRKQMGRYLLNNI